VAFTPGSGRIGRDGVRRNYSEWLAITVVKTYIRYINKKLHRYDITRWEELYQKVWIQLRRDCSKGQLSTILPNHLKVQGIIKARIAKKKREANERGEAFEVKGDDLNVLLLKRWLTGKKISWIYVHYYTPIQTALSS